MAVKTETISLKTRGHCDVHDLTGKVDQRLRKTGLKDGIVTVFAPGATAGLTTVEFESGLVDDLQALFERIVPQGIDYRHNLRWQDGNGHSHCRASLLGPSLTVPFAKGKLILGTWQQIVLLCFDNRSRSREIVCQFIGE